MHKEGSMAKAFGVVAVMGVTGFWVALIFGIKTIQHLKGVRY